MSPRASTRTSPTAPKPNCSAWGVPLDLDLTKASGGQSRRIALAHAFAHDPDILLLDEPTNHLDVPAIELLEQELASFRGACLVVSHDRRFLENVSTDRGVAASGRRAHAGQGLPRFRGVGRKQVEAGEEKAFDKLTRPAQGRRALDGARRHRPAQAQYGPRAQAAGHARRKAAERRSALADAANTANLAIDSGAQSGRLVIEAKGLSKTFQTPDGPLPIVRDLNLRIMRGDRLGLIGPNGAGKTTLLKLILGQIEPDAGALRLAKNLEIAYLDQTRTTLKPTETLWDTLAPLGGDQIIVRGHPKHVAAYAKDFMFEVQQLRQPVERPVGRRTQPPHARPCARQAFKSAGAGRTDQRSRHRDARPAGRHAGRL